MSELPFVKRDGCAPVRRRRNEGLRGAILDLVTHSPVRLSAAVMDWKAFEAFLLSAVLILGFFTALVLFVYWWLTGGLDLL
jgi:hypothetical protein